MFSKTILISFFNIDFSNLNQTKSPYNIVVSTWLRVVRRRRTPGRTIAPGMTVITSNVSRYNTPHPQHIHPIVFTWWFVGDKIPGEETTDMLLVTLCLESF